MTREGLCLCVCVALRRDLNDCLIVFQEQHSDFHCQCSARLHRSTRYKYNSEGQLSALHTYYTLEMLNFLSVLPRMNHLFFSNLTHTLLADPTLLCKEHKQAFSYFTFNIFLGIKGKERNGHLTDEEVYFDLFFLHVTFRNIMEV